MKDCLALGSARRGRWVLALGAVLCAVFLVSGIARADTSVQIIETEPGSPSTLGRTQLFSLRIGYTTSEPVVISAQGSFQGRPVPAINSAEPPLGPGQGKVLMSFAYFHAQQIDSVTVTAKTASGKIVAEASLPVALAWTEQPTTGPAQEAREAWLRRLHAEGERELEASNQALMNGPLMQILYWLVVVGNWALRGYIVLQGWLIWRLRGGWRKAAAVPLLPMGAALVYTVYAFLDGSDIFLLVLILTAPIAFLYLLIIAGLHWLSRRPAGT